MKKAQKLENGCKEMMEMKSKDIRVNKYEGEVKRH